MNWRRFAQWLWTLVVTASLMLAAPASVFADHHGQPPTPSAHHTHEHSNFGSDSNASSDYLTPQGQFTAWQHVHRQAETDPPSHLGHIPGFACCDTFFCHVVALPAMNVDILPPDWRVALITTLSFLLRSNAVGGLERPPRTTNIG